MIAFRITINDNEPVIIGQEDWSVLIATITASKNHGFSGQFGGLSKEKEHGFCEHFRWKSPEVKLSDKILIEPIESELITSPTKRFRSDKEVQESPLTEEELKDLRYESYIELKHCHPIAFK